MLNREEKIAFYDSDFMKREQEFGRKCALLCEDGQPIPPELRIEGEDFCRSVIKNADRMFGNHQISPGLTSSQLLENLQGGLQAGSQSQKVLDRYIRGIGMNYTKDLGARCAEAVATNNITDELRQEVVPLYVNDLRKDPDMIISGDDDFTHTQLADKIEKNRSECKIHIDAYIIGSASLYRFDIEESAKQNIFQILRKKLSS